jgi:hypothetical protein
MSKNGRFLLLKNHFPSNASTYSTEPNLNFTINGIFLPISCSIRQKTGKSSDRHVGKKIGCIGGLLSTFNPATTGNTTGCATRAAPPRNNNTPEGHETDRSRAFVCAPTANGRANTSVIKAYFNIINAYSSGCLPTNVAFAPGRTNTWDQM